MTRQLRSNLQPGSALWAGRRAQWKALGLSDEDIEKPKIAVVNSSSELAICFSHLDGVAAEVKKAIRAAGAVPFEVRTTAPSDFITSAGYTGAYILPSRDLIAHDIEAQVEGALLDGMICLASCDKTSPGQMMAAGRLNIPTIIAICGYQAAGDWKGEYVDIEEVFLKSAHVAAGKMTVTELSHMADNAIRSPGVCAGMGTANSMHVVTEALGMCLPGSAPVRADSAKMLNFARAAGKRIVEMVDEDLKPRDILTPEAIENAVKMVLAVSGSINCVKHLRGIAVEAGLDVDVIGLFAKHAANVPLLTDVRPNGPTVTEEFEMAGGARGILKRLEKNLHKGAMTVTGRTLGDELAEAPVPPADSKIRTLEAPVSTRPTINIVRGSLLPGGGIIRLGGQGERKLTHTGPARIYHSRDEALAAIKADEVKKGDVLVLRGLGVKGGPGMALTSAVVFALDGVGLIEDVPVITEGQVSGLVNTGLVVGEASPEAAAGGPMTLLENGDEITIDVTKGTVDLNVPAEVLAKRTTIPEQFGQPTPAGWLDVYRRTVGPVHEGAVMTQPKRLA
ncbi:MAG: dihydroxy-acid dehydratase [Qingshengfaniella sp.]